MFPVVGDRHRSGQTTAFYARRRGPPLLSPLGQDRATQDSRVSVLHRHRPRQRHLQRQDEDVTGRAEAGRDQPAYGRLLPPRLDQRRLGRRPPSLSFHDLVRHQTRPAESQATRARSGSQHPSVGPPRRAQRPRHEQPLGTAGHPGGDTDQ